MSERRLCFLSLPLMAPFCLNRQQQKARLIFFFFFLYYSNDSSYCSSHWNLNLRGVGVGLEWHTLNNFNLSDLHIMHERFSWVWSRTWSRKTVRTVETRKHDVPWPYVFFHKNDDLHVISKKKIWEWYHPTLHHPLMYQSHKKFVHQDNTPCHLFPTSTPMPSALYLLYPTHCLLAVQGSVHKDRNPSGQ